MNGYFRGSRLLAGVALPRATHTGLVTHDERKQDLERKRRRALQSATIRSASYPNVRFVQPIRLNWARYERVTRTLHGKITAAGVMVTVMAMIMLGWKAAGGEHITPVRWLYSVGSGWFITWMIRLAMFTCLAAPRFVSFQNGSIRLSGFGTLKPGQILRWSFDYHVMPDEHDSPCIRLEILCRWFWWKRRWTMLLDDGAEANRLQHLLQTQTSPAAGPTAILGESCN
ncbi:hypothetical protein [Prosthecobacter sp.]|uniref:hypothetical protein n=1 Tax=Prosthecobacter sp. TaxID=1965333 RepID=UPI002ABAC681|nr:hypothetical protein [Prosthecobacter sp.]MDZ4405385.1 hypothetical protein [Prosthecobacter sp.]